MAKSITLNPADRDELKKRFDLVKALPIVKLDENAHMVWGIASSETPDSEDEIADFDGTTKAFTNWAEDSLSKTADGADPSLGNIRVMHQLQVGGKAVKIEFKKDSKQIWLGSTPATDEVWGLLKGGFLKGYSIGGSYAPGSKKAEGSYTRYTPVISEVSYVDLPANPDASFQYIKADGSMELRKFASSDESRTKLAELSKEAKTKRVAGKDLPSSAFAYVGDKDKTETWKLPIHDASHVRNALARFNQTQGIPADEKAKVKAKIDAAAKKFNITVSEESSKTVRSIEFLKEHGMPAADGVRKGMYTVGRMAEVLECLSSMQMGLAYERDYEGDDSPIATDVAGIIEQLQEIFLALAEEESSELVAMLSKSDAAKAAKGEETMNEELKKALETELNKFKELAKGAIDLLKATHKGMAGHFKKAAAFHEKIAAHHGQMSKAHMDHAEALGSGHENHKFHKAMAAHHDKCMKANEAHGAHCLKMAEAHSDATSEDSAKAAAAMDVLAKGGPELPVEPATKAQETTVAAEAGDLAKNLNSQLIAMVKSATESAIAEIKNSDEFKKSISEAAITQMKQALGATIMPTEVTLVPRSTPVQKVNGAAVVAGNEDINDCGI